MAGLMKYMFIATALLLSLMARLEAQDIRTEKGKSDSAVKRHCLSLKDIRRIEVVDNQTLLFHTRGKEVWKNTLPAPCFGLASGGIGYKNFVDELCDRDIVIVLHNRTPCQLGTFERVEMSQEGGRQADNTSDSLD